VPGPRLGSRSTFGIAAAETTIPVDPVSVGRNFRLMKLSWPMCSPRLFGNTRSSGFLNLERNLQARRLATSCPEIGTVRTPGALFGAPSSG
jgi:hypothetical protein